jgi:hypothetical protein
MAQSYCPVHQEERFSDEGTMTGDNPNDASHLRVQTSQTSDRLGKQNVHSPLTPSQEREKERRLDDELAMLQAESVVSNQQHRFSEGNIRSKSMRRSRSQTDSVDDFVENTTPEQNQVYRPPENPSTRMAKMFRKIHNSSFLVRYFFYITPLALIILVPLLLGALKFKTANVGGVQLLWFSVWLEVIWLTLWGSRVSIPS